MKSLQRLWISGVVLLLLMGIFFFRHEIRSFFFGFRLLSQSFFDRSFQYERLHALELENLVLKEEVRALRRGGAQGFLADDFLFQEAYVYALYPFNDKSTLVISFGEKDGARQGMPVVGLENVLIGKITAVTRTQSEAQTLFDSRWVSSVEVGGQRVLENRTRAVFKGGIPPHLELVPRDASLREGDMVFSLSQEFPIHTLVGRITRIEKGEGAFFKEVVVSPLFDVESLRTVRVLLNFP